MTKHWSEYQVKTWIDNLAITEEPSKDKNGKPSTIFYIREKPFRLGYSYQSTALTENAAQWTIANLRQIEIDIFNAKIERLKEKHAKMAWFTWTIAWKLNRMHRNPGMNLINGLTEKDLKRLSLSQLKRYCGLASGRAIQYQTDNKHNTAACWLSIAATIYRYMNDRTKR